MTYDELLKIMDGVFILSADKNHFPLEKSWKTKKWSAFGEGNPAYSDDEMYGAKVLKLVPCEYVSDGMKKKKEYNCVVLYAVLDLE